MAGNTVLVVNGHVRIWCALGQSFELEDKALFLLKVAGAAVLVIPERPGVPVMEKGRLVGLVSIGDLVKASLEEKDFVIKQLKKYIKGDQ